MQFKLLSDLLPTNYYKTIDIFFQPLLQSKTLEAASRVGWFNTDTQKTRFDLLVEVGDLSGASVLDVGSGLGHFYGYLQQYAPDVVYTGIDILPQMVHEARISYGKEHFHVGSLELIKDEFDFVCASGTFSAKINNNLEFVQSQIRKMFSIAKKGVAFNLLKSHCEFVVDPKLFFYNPVDIVAYCKTLSSSVKLCEDYLDNDFTVYLYK